MPRRLVLTAGCLGLAALSVVYAAGQDLTRAEAVSMEKKLAAILARGNAVPVRAAKPLRTPLTEREVNAYLKYSSQPQLPAGLANPRIAITEGNRVEARALLDLTALRKSKPRGWLDPLGYVAGSMEVALVAHLYAVNGKGLFQIQSATLGGVSIPKSLLQELVSYYSRTPDHPNGFDLDSPFNLPLNIRQVEVQRGAATIIQ
jgi:hypothetical protein